MNTLVDKDEFRKRLGGNIAAAREKQHLTQSQLAEQSGIHRVTLAKIETGRFTPASDLLVDIAEALAVSVDTLTSSSI